LNSSKTLQSANDFAPAYDDYISKRGWCGPEILFGLLFEYLKKDEKLLDIGIGTGLSSLLFHKAGITITGIDGSNEMLGICKKKNISEELLQLDITKGDFPFADSHFDYVISHAVFHLTGILDQLFSEVARIIKVTGKFAFTVDELSPETDIDYSESEKSGVFEKLNKDSGIKVFKHSDLYIKELLVKNNFKILKQTNYLAFKDVEEQREVHFTLYVAEKIC
jgi:predicted TPR repeat methyltransferase